ncbi:MAG: helix-turn-helix domain-containing protein [Pseudomonadota bacterium]
MDLTSPSLEPVSAAQDELQRLCLCAGSGDLSCAICDSFDHLDVKIRRMARGDLIAHEQAYRSALLMVRYGLLATTKQLSGRRRQLVSLRQPGEVFCSINAFDQSFRTLALAPSDVIILKLETLSDATVTDYLFQLAHAELLNLSSRTVLLGRMTAAERVLSFLNELVEHQGETSGDSVQVDLAMTREDIADYLGLKAETVSRVLGRVRNTGLIVFDGPTHFSVPDPAALRGFDAMAV